MVCPYPEDPSVYLHSFGQFFRVNVGVNIPFPWILCHSNVSEFPEFSVSVNKQEISIRISDKSRVPTWICVATMQKEKCSKNILPPNGGLMVIYHWTKKKTPSLKFNDDESHGIESGELITVT